MDSLCEELFRVSTGLDDIKVVCFFLFIEQDSKIGYNFDPGEFP